MKRILALLCVIFLLTVTITTNKASATKNNTNKAASSGAVTKSEDIYWPDSLDDSEITAESAILMDADTGLVLFEKNSHDVNYPASITKIMTSLLTLENASLGEIVTFSRAAALGIEAGSSSVATDIGEKLTIEQCLYAIMLESANEVCLGVAEHISGDINSFADMMNAKAKQLGCKDTHFSNPNGLHSDEHYTTAYDMALISREALKSSEFRTITDTKLYKVAKTNKKPERTWLNHHQMIYGWKYPKYQDDLCIGGKTGFTQKAGNTLVTFAEKDGMTLIVVVMRAQNHASFPNANQYTDTKKLFDYGFGNFTVHHMANIGVGDPVEDSPLFTKYTDLFNENRSPIYISDNGTILLPNGVSDSEVEREITYQPRTLSNTGETMIGTITYTYNNKAVGSSNILCRPISEPRLVAGKTTEIKEIKSIPQKTNGEQKNLKFILIGIGIVAIIFLCIYFFWIRPKRRAACSYYAGRKKRAAKEMDVFKYR